jgi:hypothetical protein
MSTSCGAVRLRQISEADLTAIADLLSEGFPTRSKTYWLRGLRRHSIRQKPKGYPAYGYLLESGSVVVGVILLLFSNVPSAGGAFVRCNVSSWYVRPKFRIFGSLLITSTTKDKNVTYVNISPAPHTWSTVEAQGFSVYCRGQMYSLPSLQRPVKTVQIDVFNSSMADLDASDREILSQHSTFGCLSLVVRFKNQNYPFVFQKHYWKGFVPICRLIYCRDTAEYTRFASNLGRFLLGRGSICVQLDANDAVPGLVGWFTDRRGRKYSKGPHPPRLGDLSFTEVAFFDT